MTTRSVIAPMAAMAVLVVSARAACAFAAASRTVVRNVQILPLEADAPTAVITGQTIVVEDGRIATIKPPSDEDLRAGDMLVDGNGAWLVAGFIEVANGPAPGYAALTHAPLRGVTTVVGRFGPQRRGWYARLDREAAIHGPTLADLPADAVGPWQQLAPPAKGTSGSEIAGFLRESTSERARKLGLNDRGRIAVGQRGDFVILERNPFEDPTTIATPIEVVIGGETMRRSALETNRKMIAEADAAIAALPDVRADQHAFLIESSGLRVGRLVVTKDGREATDWWGPPVSQTTQWTMVGDPHWHLRMTQVVEHGFTITMEIMRGATSTRARAQLIAPEKLEPSETTLDASPAEPLLDPISLALRLRAALAALPEGGHHDVEIVEPVPEPGKLKVGIRTLRWSRADPASVPVPVEAGERVFRIESPPAASGSVSTGADGAIAGWLVLDQAGLPLRASLVAPEGITEYFRSLPQPEAGSDPQVKRP